jgi:2-polyprenyl-3-methyl-5-hydroxy-6-metoxy-1,4-benzoquinol methylase
MSTVPLDAALELRARQSLGSSSDAIHRMVARAVATHAPRAARLVDVGCGRGDLWAALQPITASYSGLDAVFYDGFPIEGEFIRANLDDDEWPLPRANADVVTAVETIEHVENPWAFMRQLSGLAKPGGVVIVTTPNQLSMLSIITLVMKRRFSAFQDSHYPAHRTALLESDLDRAVSAAGLEAIETTYSLCGRLPLSAWHYPTSLASLFPRALSDNLMLISRKRHG